MRYLLLLLFLLTQGYAFSLDSIIAQYDTTLIDTTKSIEYNEKRIRSYFKDKPLYTALTLAELAAQEGLFEEARDQLINASTLDPLATAVVQRRLGDLYLSSGQIVPAINAFIAAYDATTNKGYRKYLQRRINHLKKMYREDLAAMGWTAIGHEVITSEKEPTPADTLRSYWKEHLKESGLTDSLFDSLYAQRKSFGGTKRMLWLVRDTSLVTRPFATEKMFDIAKLLSTNGYNRNASDWLLLAVAQPDFSQVVDRVSYLNFRALLNYALGNSRNAIDWARQKFKEFGSSPQLLFNTARSYRKLGMQDSANYFYQKYTEDFPRGKQTYGILWYLAWGAEERNELDSAIALFDAVSKAYPKRKYADDAALRVGLNTFRKGDYQGAVNSFLRFQKKFYDSELVPASSYWLARSYRELGDSIQMDSTLHALFTTTPFDYYAWRGREIIGDTSYLTVEVNLIDSAQWQEKLRKNSKGVLDSLFSPQELSELEFLIYLGTLGYDKEVEFLLRPFEGAMRSDLPAFYRMIHYLNDIGVYHRSYWLSKRLYYAIPYENRWNFPKEYIQLLYPLVFDKELQDAAQVAQVPPNLVRAIMRQESMFSPEIMSYVGAMGLMQIMPYTGKEIAKDLDTVYTDEMLLDPKVNLRFGSYYIGKLLQQFNNSKVEAIASYNGGPHNVKKWVAKNQEVYDDTPYFVECVGFSETRNYVKRVLENYWTYNYLTNME